LSHLIAQNRPSAHLRAAHALTGMKNSPSTIRWLTRSQLISPTLIRSRLGAFSWVFFDTFLVKNK